MPAVSLQLSRTIAYCKVKHPSRKAYLNTISFVLYYNLALFTCFQHYVIDQYNVNLPPMQNSLSSCHYRYDLSLENFQSSSQSKKLQLYSQPDKLRGPKRCLSDIGVNFRPIFPIWCPPWGSLFQLWLYRSSKICSRKAD